MVEDEREYKGRQPFKAMPSQPKRFEEDRYSKSITRESVSQMRSQKRSIKRPSTIRHRNDNISRKTEDIEIEFDAKHAITIDEAVSSNLALS